MAELWLGNNVKTSNQFPVIEVKNGETVKAVIDYIDNPWDTFLEITALAEEAPLYTEFIITINPGKKQEKTIRKKVVFDSAKKWVRFTVPIDSDNLIRVQDSYIHCDEKDLKYGMDMGHNSFTVKSNCSGKNNILIRNFRLLF